MAFYSERSAWSTRDMAQFKAGLERAGPRIPGNFYKTEGESDVRLQ